MDITNRNAIFTKDEEGVIIITDIAESSAVIRGEVLYDGKNTVVLNRNNTKYYALKNIPLFIRKVLSESEDVTIVENNDKGDIYSYSVKINFVDDLGFKDDWNEYSAEVIKNLEKNLTQTEFASLIQNAEKIYENIK